MFSKIWLDKGTRYPEEPRTHRCLITKYCHIVAGTLSTDPVIYKTKISHDPFDWNYFID